MKRKYDAPELELFRLTLRDVVLNVSDPEGGHSSDGSPEGPGENEGGDF